MLIVLGTRSRARAGVPFFTETCPACGHGQHLSYGVTRYFQVFWIPIFPYRRVVGLRCLNCHHTREGKNLPEHVRNLVGQEMFSFARLLPYFAGIYLVVIMGALFEWDENRIREKDLLLLQEPRVGDVYEMKINGIMPNPQPGYPYILARVAATDSHSVFLEYGALGYDGYMGTSDAMKNREYTRDSYFLEGWNRVEIDTLVTWRRDGAIFDVLRPREE
jgi:hypothetical protein